MSKEWNVSTSSFKCPACNRLLQTERITLSRFQYLSKDILDMYRDKKLNKLIFYHTMDNEEDVWCELNLQSTHNNFDVYRKGYNIYSLVPDHPLGEIGDYLENKTKIYTGTMSTTDICMLLQKMFYIYDIRLLGDNALSQHPSYSVIEEYSDFSKITLELIDGMTDDIVFRYPSVASGIVHLCIAENTLLSKWFHT